MRPASILFSEDAGGTFLRNMWDIVNYRLDGPEFESRQFFSFPGTSRPALRPTSATPTHWIHGSFPGLTWLGLKADHSLHLGSGSRMSGTIRLRPLYAFMVWTGTLPFFHVPPKYWRISAVLHEATTKSDGSFVCVLQDRDILSALILLLLLLAML
jgi:hypothetical protein